MPYEWRFSILILLYKNEEDIKSCNSHRGIELLSLTMKVWEMVIDKKNRRDVVILKNQFGFMHGLF